MSAKENDTTAKREIKYKGKNIAEVLDMTVEDALEFFGLCRLFTESSNPHGCRSYVRATWAAATTLSGGEAQRVKLSAGLSKGYR